MSPSKFFLRQYWKKNDLIILQPTGKIINYPTGNKQAKVLFAINHQNDTASKLNNIQSNRTTKMNYPLCFSYETKSLCIRLSEFYPNLAKTARQTK